MTVSFTKASNEGKLVTLDQAGERVSVILIICSEAELVEACLIVVANAFQISITRLTTS